MESRCSPKSGLFCSRSGELAEINIRREKKEEREEEGRRKKEDQEEG